MRVNRRQHFFTLVEVLVVFLIIGVVASTVAIGVNEMIQQQRFRNDVDRVVDRLRLAQDLMLVLDAEVTVRLSNDEEGFICQLLTEDSLFGGWKRELERAETKLRQVSSVAFNDQSIAQGEVLDLLFFSAGFAMSKGTLKLVAEDGKQQYICLAGYPHPIARTLVEQACDDKQQEEDDKTLTLSTVGEVQALARVEEES